MAQDIYSSAILTEKREDFLIFLRQIGILEDEVTFQIRGHYSVFSVNLSNKEYIEICHIKEELRNSILDFL